MLPQPLVQVSVITMNDGKVLIGRNPDEGGKWETPTAVIGAFEGIKEAAVRAVVALTGVVTDPQNVIFVSEVLKQGEAVHKIIIYLFSKYTSGAESMILDGMWSEAQWVDTRELGQYQNSMTDETVDAFYKFSMILRQSAARSGAQA